MANSPLSLKKSIENNHHEPYSSWNRRVKGASPEYIAQTNKDYEDVIPFLRESGYDVDSFKDSVGIEKHLDDLFAKIDADEELQGLYNRRRYNEGNDLYNKRYGKIFNALDKAWDKFATDEYVKDAPFGYEDDDLSKYDKSKYLVKETSTQNPDPSNYSYWDDKRIKGAFNFGNGSWDDMVRYMKDNKGLAKFDIIRGK